MIIIKPSRRFSSPAPGLLDPWTPPSSRLCHTLLLVFLGLKHVLFKLIALKCSMRLYNEAFKIGILRRRQELGRILNFKCIL